MRLTHLLEGYRLACSIDSKVTRFPKSWNIAKALNLHLNRIDIQVRLGLNEIHSV